MKQQLEPLFTPWKIGNCQIKNRIVLTSMGGTNLLGWMEVNHFDKDGAKFILEVAKNNCGLVLPGCQPVYNPMYGQRLYKKKKMYQDLKAVTDSGVSTEILINAVENGTNPFGCTDYLNQKKKIRDAGVHIYEYLGKQDQHTKTVLADDRISIVGSCNFDMRSVYLDTELMLVIDSPEINAQLRKQIGQMKESCRHMHPDGALQDGSQYQIPPQEWQKKLIYSVLRVIIIPIRHLL